MGWVTVLLYSSVSVWRADHRSEQIVQPSQFVRIGIAGFSFRKRFRKFSSSEIV